MELPDEAIAYDYKNLLAPTQEDWTPAAELRQQHFLAPGKLRDLVPRAMQVRSQVATERDLQEVPAEMQPRRRRWSRGSKSCWAIRSRRRASPG